MPFVPESRSRTRNSDVIALRPSFTRPAVMPSADVVAAQCGADARDQAWWRSRRDRRLRVCLITVPGSA